MCCFRFVADSSGFVVGGGCVCCLGLWRSKVYGFGGGC